MNKRILMLVPFMGLLLTSCGRQWKEMDKDKFFETKSEIFSNMTLPKTGKSSYEGNQATLYYGNVQKNIGPILSFNLDKYYYQVTEFNIKGTISKKVTYYVAKDNALYKLVIVDGEKTSKTKLEGTVDEAFENECIPGIRNSLTKEFWFGRYSKVEDLVSALDLLISCKADGVVEYKFYSSNNNSLKFSYKIDKATFTDVPPGANEDIVKYTGSEEFVIENGLISYVKSSGNTVDDITYSQTSGELTSTNSHLRYQYNVDVTPEVNPDDWPAD